LEEKSDLIEKIGDFTGGNSKIVEELIENYLKIVSRAKPRRRKDERPDARGDHSAAPQICSAAFK